MAKHLFEPIERELEKVSVYGSEISANGTRLIGHAPHVAPLAYYHIIFPPLEPQEIVHLEKQIGQHLPSDLKDFLLISNGLGVFIGELSVFGLRHHFDRSIAASREPFSLITENTLDRPPRLDRNLFLIGGGNQNGSHYAINTTSGEISHLHPRSLRPIAQWENIWDMLLQEVTRLQQEFESGKEKAPR